MGQRVCVLARDDQRFKIVAALGREKTSESGLAAGSSCDVVLDFSSSSGAERAARLAVQHHAALLVGTTGLSRQTLGVLDDAARSQPVMIAPNTALGIVVLNHLTTEAARLLGRRFDVDIVERHHAGKRDAPSGTARRLADLLRKKSGLAIGPERIHSIRAGDVVGEHAIHFAGPGQCLKILHSVTDRDVFAAGALRAAAWLSGRAPGAYTIEQAFGLATDPLGARGDG
jgi:4-hydroxy-tetrahydrodipicolinate reductase